jgi:hypothetical protein
MNSFSCLGHNYHHLTSHSHFDTKFLFSNKTLQRLCGRVNCFEVNATLVHSLLVCSQGESARLEAMCVKPAAPFEQCSDFSPTHPRILFLLRRFLIPFLWQSRWSESKQNTVTAFGLARQCNAAWFPAHEPSPARLSVSQSSHKSTSCSPPPHTRPLACFEDKVSLSLNSINYKVVVKPLCCKLEGRGFDIR